MQAVPRGGGNVLTVFLVGPQLLRLGVRRDTGTATARVHGEEKGDRRQEVESRCSVRTEPWEEIDMIQKTAANRNE